MKNSAILFALFTFYSAVINIFCWYEKRLHCSFLCNLIASANFYNFSAFSWFENFLRNKSVILNICAVVIN